jgi:cytochrome c biogenesis factor
MSAIIVECFAIQTDIGSATATVFRLWSKGVMKWIWLGSVKMYGGAGAQSRRHGNMEHLWSSNLD